MVLEQAGSVKQAGSKVMSPQSQSEDLLFYRFAMTLLPYNAYQSRPYLAVALSNAPSSFSFQRIFLPQAFVMVLQKVMNPSLCPLGQFSGVLPFELIHSTVF